jgi:hypothetical protein
MKLDYLKEKTESVSVVLLVASAFLAVLTLVKAAGFFAASARAESVVKNAIAQNETDANDMDNSAKYKALANELKENNLFAPPPPKQHPVKEVWGIFGNEVLIRDRWYKIGAKVGEAKIVAIGPAKVTIAWDGKEKTFPPIAARDSSQPGGPRGSIATAKSSESKGGSAQMVAVGSSGRPMGGRGGMEGMRGRFQNMSEVERHRLRAEMQVRRAEQDERGLRYIQERWPTMSEQEREKIRELQKKWPSMSEEERDKIRAGIPK